MQYRGRPGHQHEAGSGFVRGYSAKKSLTVTRVCCSPGSTGKRRTTCQYCERGMAYSTHVSVLSHLHLNQMEEIKPQNWEIKRLFTLLEKHQAMLEPEANKLSPVLKEVPLFSTANLLAMGIAKAGI